MSGNENTTPSEETPVEETVVEETVEETESEPVTKFDEKDVKALRSEAANYRVKWREEQNKTAELARKLDEFERAKLSETERLQLEHREAVAENEKLKAAVRSTRLESEVVKAAKDLKLADVDATLRLMDTAELEFDDSGRPVNLNHVLESTLERFPLLKLADSPRKSPAADPGTTNPPKARAVPLSREAISAMSSTERKQREAEINAWMLRGYKN
jgi:hypothetical protein